MLRIEGTPIDYLDFASPEPGLGGKLGLDATRKRSDTGTVANAPKKPPKKGGLATSTGKGAALTPKSKKKIHLTNLLLALPFVYRTFTFCGLPFQVVRLGLA